MCCMKKILLVILLIFSVSLFAQNIEVGFAQKGKDQTARNLVIKTIESAKNEIRMACYNFTDIVVIVSLIDASKRGIDVKIVHDSDVVNQKNDGTALIRESKAQIKLDSKYAIMHNKFIIVDGVTVETGSYNYSENANNSNAENVIVIWNNPDVAKKYLDIWYKLWNESK